MEPLIFLAAVAVAAVVMVVVFHVQDRRARAEEEQHKRALARHLRVVRDQDRYLTDDPRRPE